MDNNPIQIFFLPSREKSKELRCAGLGKREAARRLVVLRKMAPGVVRRCRLMDFAGLAAALTTKPSIGWIPLYQIPIGSWRRDHQRRPEQFDITVLCGWFNGIKKCQQVDYVRLFCLASPRYFKFYDKTH